MHMSWWWLSAWREWHGWICLWVFSREDIHELDCPTNIVQDTLAEITAGNDDCTQTGTTLNCPYNCQCIAGQDCSIDVCWGNQNCVDVFGKGKEKNTIIGSVCEETSGPAPSQSPISSTDAPTTEAPTTGCQPLSRQLLLVLLTLNVVWNILANVIVSVLVGHGLNRHMELFSLSQLELLPAHALMIVRLVKVARVDSSARIFLSWIALQILWRIHLSDITAGNDCTQTDTTLTCQSNCQCIAGHDCPDNICCGNQICVDEYGKEGKRRILSSERFVSKGKGVL